MLYIIAEQLGFPGVLNLIRYISFRAGAASATALAIGLLLGPWFIVAMAPLYFKYHTLRYKFDDEGIGMSWGVFWRREIHLTYARIQDIHLSRGLFERWLGLATIQVQTASGNSGLSSRHSSSCAAIIWSIAYRRTARSRNSSPYFLGAAMTLILHGLRASIRPGAIQSSMSGCGTTTPSGPTPRSATLHRRPSPKHSTSSDWVSSRSLPHPRSCATTTPGLWSPQDERRGSGQPPP